MRALLYVRLVGFTAATLLQLFWMVVILGHRRQRNFERVLFLVCLALFLFYSGSLLALNAEIHYTQFPAELRGFIVTLLSAGLCFLPPLLVHLHIEYAATRGLRLPLAAQRAVLWGSYATVAYFGALVYPAIVAGRAMDFLIPGNSLGRVYGAWFAVCMLACAGWEEWIQRGTPSKTEKRFHRLLAVCFAGGAGLVFYLHVLGGPADRNVAGWLSTGVSLLAVPPLALLIYLVQRYNFLQIGRQKNLLYAVSAAFLALLYLSLVRRVSGWLEEVLPPEATAAILLFVLVIFVEPLQRMLSGRMRETAHKEMDRLQRLMGEIQQDARQGSPASLARFVEQRVREEFELGAVRLELRSRGAREAEPAPALTDKDFPLRLGEQVIGNLHAEPHGASLSGETRAALEFLSEQLPGALDLCRLLEEKLQLERELAERERLALVGQMAASISHNLKNPLGSIKTILQVQLESEELPEKLRGETRLVLDEISRLSAKLNQLLQFSRPAVRPAQSGAGCDAHAVGDEVAAVLRREAERRGIAFETAFPARAVQVAASHDAVSDVLSNLVVNALEAAPNGGRVAISIAVANGNALLSVEDNGPGIPAGLRARILRPFFTTKAQGTGLGLAIVSRRVAEAGGKLEWESPLSGGRGTRFRATLPLAEGASEEKLRKAEP
ncbi:MAG TPA: ATP-binding protein [Methylomirabilota bacterium]|nr:ATP-binding protein [Methylomirabilota bacterium]